MFGLTAAEVESMKRTGYRPADYVEHNDELRAALDLIGSGQLSRGDRETFRPLLDSLLHSDPFLVLADFAAYVACQEQVDAAWSDTDRWTRMSIANTAHAGTFSSDRAVREYASRIWGLKPAPVTLE